MQYKELKDFKLKELSLVGNPANQHATISIFKNVEDNHMPNEVNELQKSLEEKNTEIETLKASVEKLNSTVATLEKKAKMSDKEKEYMDEMDDEEEKKKFLDLSSDARKSLIAKRETNDETIMVAGQQVRKSAVGEHVFAVMKAQAEQAERDREELRKANDERLNAELKSIVETSFASLPGTVDERVAALKAIRQIENETARKNIEAVYEIAEKSNSALFNSVGKSYSYTPSNGVSDVNKAYDEFNTKVQEVAKSFGLKEIDAIKRVSAENPELVERMRGKS